MLYEFSHDCLNQGSNADLLLLTASELPQYDRWSKVFIYDSNNAEPNKEVIDADKVNDNVVSITEAIQRSSWSFYKPLMC